MFENVDVEQNYKGAGIQCYNAMARSNTLV